MVDWLIGLGSLIFASILVLWKLGSEKILKFIAVDFYPAG